MCGIIGYTGSRSAMPKLIGGLSSLEYRGYDSAGVAFFEKGGDIRVIKARGRLEALKVRIAELKPDEDTSCGIGHTRWATHGEPSDVNSHPHGTERVSIVHNGIIENYAEIKKELGRQGYSFESETDTEVGAKLIDQYYREEHDPVRALLMAARRFSGSFAIGALFSDYPGMIYAIRRESPLIAARGDDGSFIASDISAVLGYTRDYIRIGEGETVVLSEDSIKVLNSEGNEIRKETLHAEWDSRAAEKGGYPYYMLKEIHEEPEAVLKTLRPRIKDGIPDFGIPELSAERLAGFKRIHIIACGTAMHAGMIGKFAFEGLARIPVSTETASEFRYRDPILSRDELALIISQSGETADTLAALRLAKERGVFTAAIVNVPDSTIAVESDCVIYTWAGPEIAVASTKAYSVQISLLFLLAVSAAIGRGTVTLQAARELSSELTGNIPGSIEKVFSSERQCSEIARRIMNHKNIFFIGRGVDYALCAEAALKLKEISYIHCEAYPAGELKHGTISLVTDGTPVFAIACQQSIFDKMISNIREVKARGAYIVLICPEGVELPAGIADDTIRVPAVSDLFLAIPTITVTQLIAYYASYQLGIDVDKPRNLAKSVTVE